MRGIEIATRTRLVVVAAEEVSTLSLQYYAYVDRGSYSQSKAHEVAVGVAKAVSEREMRRDRTTIAVLAGSHYVGSSVGRLGSNSGARLAVVISDPDLGQGEGAP